MWRRLGFLEGVNVCSYVDMPTKLYITSLKRVTITLPQISLRNLITQ